MKYKITKIETVKETNRLYIAVDFLDGAEQVIHRNDFVMVISPTQTIYTGPELAEGETPDPKLFETVETDVPAVIATNIERYIARNDDVFSGKPADYRSRSIESDTSDPLGLRARPGVLDLVDSVRQVSR